MHNRAALGLIGAAGRRRNVAEEAIERDEGTDILLFVANVRLTLPDGGAIVTLGHRQQITKGLQRCPKRL